jgi:hypothetical protein
MLRKIRDAFHSWKQKRRTKKSSPLVNRRPRLGVEPLERRDLLSTLLWIGPGNGNFNNANNWINEATGVQVAPAEYDNLVFNPLLTVGTTRGSPQNAVDDEPVPFQFGNITLAPAFQAAVTFAQREIKSNTVTLQGGILDSAVGATVTIGGTLIWNAGTLQGDWQVGNSSDVPSLTGTMTIQLDPQIQNPQPIRLNGDLTVDKGTLTWASGNITYNQSELSINPNGTFTITGDANLTANQNTMAIINDGTIQKTNGSPTSQTSFDGVIDNSALIQVSAGNLVVSGGIDQDAGTTRLNGGNLNVGAGALELLGGTLNGVGTITGNVNNGDPTGQQQGAGTVLPGLNNGPGTLNITGNFAQTNAGTLYINVNSNGTGVLNITGTASLGGTLYVNRDTNYRPNRGTSLTFLTYTGGRNGTDFFNVAYSNPRVWTDAQGNNDQFTNRVGDNAYTLVVIGVSM